MTDDGYDSKNKKSPVRTCACTYAGKSFIYYPSYPSSVTLEDPAPSDL